MNQPLTSTIESSHNSQPQQEEFSSVKIFQVGDHHTASICREEFDKERIVVGRLGEVYAAWVKANSKKATDSLYKAKKRPRSKPFSLLCPVEFLQRIVDLSKVTVDFQPLLQNTKLLKRAVCDKVFLAVPVSEETVNNLNIPSSICSKVKVGADVFYIIYAISGQNSDYDSIQEKLCPTFQTDISDHDLIQWTENNLVAITSWNESGAGSNHGDLEEAVRLCRLSGVNTVITQHPSRGKPHGSYGIIDTSILRKRKKVRRKPIAEDGEKKHWNNIIKELNKCKKQAYKESLVSQNEQVIEGSGF